MALSGALRRLIDFGSGWALEAQQAVLRDMCMGQVEKFTAVNFGSIQQICIQYLVDPYPNNWSQTALWTCAYHPPNH